MMDKKLRFAVIFNSNTASRKKLNLINKVISSLQSSHDVELFKTQNERDAKEVFKKLSAKNFDRLVVAGGDGSVCFAINQIIDDLNFKDKLLGYIPTGTTNILQIETQIKKRSEEIFNVLISDNHKKISLAKINNKYFFLMAGVGFDSKIVESVNVKIKKYLGKMIFVYKGFEHFLFLKNNKMEIVIDNEKILADWVLCTSSKYYAGSYSITNDTNIFANKIITYIFKDLSRVNLLYYVWLILTKGDLSSAKSVIKKDVDQLKINMLKNKLLFHVDGENCGYDDSLQIQTTNKFINLLVP
jgi:diacylglycerol kinase (ATP)